MTTIAITGHRLGPKLGGYAPNPLGLDVQAALRAEIEDIRPATLISGMALGVDQWAAWIAVKLGVPFIAALPCAEQALKWNAVHQANYVRLLDLASEVFLVTKLYDAGCMQRRNEWMVDHCDVLLAVWDGSNSGTSNCVRYAERAGRTVVRIDPPRVAEATPTSARLASSPTAARPRTGCHAMRRSPTAHPAPRPS